MATTYAANSSIEFATMGIDVNMDGTQPRRLTIPTIMPIPISVQSPEDSPTSPPTQLPLPNPPFVFPNRPSSSSAPSSLSRATGRRPLSAIELRGKGLGFGSDLGIVENLGNRRSPRMAALPDFSFNPGAKLKEDALRTGSAALPDFSFNPGADMASESSLLSPPLSPASPHLSVIRGGHRRGGSEFVGGNLRDGDSIQVMMNSSPTKSESGLASPQPAPVERRGRHAHRRSAAISSHDLTMILKPSTPSASRGSSAPASPSGFDNKIQPFSQTKDDPPKPEPEPDAGPASDPEPVPEPETTKVECPMAAPVEAPCESGPLAKPTARARVGFSDTLEYIPRPLSLVSIDTTSSTITGRYGHSVSGSISSIISLSNSITTDRDTPGVLSSPTFEKQGDSRPSTAGAVLERSPSTIVVADDENMASPRRRNSIPLLSGLPTADSSSPTTPSPTKTPKRWSFFGLEPRAPGGSPTTVRPQSSSSSESASKGHAVICTSDDEVANDESETPADPKKESSKKRKQKKVKLWAGSILIRKPKARSQKTKTGHRRTLTPPPPKLDLDDDRDEDEYMDITEPATAPAALSRKHEIRVEEPRIGITRPSLEEEAQYMIDLDAALGPFNTPSARDPAWEEAQRAGAPPKRKLHSAAAARSGFLHRRTESAPEMPPFEANRFGFHRFGSSSTMADVFEEEEEDEESDAKTSEVSTPDASELPTKDGDAKSVTEESVPTPTQETEASMKDSESHSLAASVKRKGSGSSLDMQPPGSRIRTDISANPLHEVIVEEEPVRRAVDQERIYEAVSDPTDLAMPSPHQVLTSKDPLPVEVHPINLPNPSLMPLSPYSASQSSSIPSPRSPMSYDNRVSTAPSSITEENDFQSLLMGEPGPEVVRISVDVPSLTSSNSTTTRESNFPGFQPRNTPFHEQRPASFTATAFGRRRSSLASLSRLISSAHGERSKLNMEVPLEADAEKKAKVSKAARISRMMKFWKKESNES